VRRWWRYTKHHHAHPGMVLKLGARGHAEHQKHVQMGIVSRFGRWGGGGDTPRGHRPGGRLVSPRKSLEKNF